MSDIHDSYTRDIHGGDPVEPKPYRISHSQLDTYLQCGKKFYFAHEYEDGGLEPDKHSRALTLGTIGHKLFEGFFSAKKDGVGDKAAMFNAMEFAQEYKGEDEYFDALRLVSNWIAANPETIARWEVIETEHTYFLPVGVADDGRPIEFPFTSDLIVRDRVNGKIFAVDHKFLTDFYKDELMALFPQLPKYVGALRALGLNVDDAYYNMVRTRNLKAPQPEDLYKLHRLNLTDARIVEAMKQQIEGMFEIANSPKKKLRTINKMNCGNCGFLELCIEEANQRPTRALIKHGYKKNSYGYDDI